MDGVTTVPDSGVPPVTWWGTSDGYAHAFRGVERLPACRAWWAGRVTPAHEGYTRCATCELIVFGAPGELAEAWGR